MAGTLTISTLSDGTNSTSATNCIQGSAKAWVTWTGSTGAILASYNVSSITRAGTGNYTINFTTAFADTKYVLSGYAEWANGSSADAGITYGGDSTKSTSSCRVMAFVYPSGASYDPVSIGIACFR